MKIRQQLKGPWVHRFSIRFFTILLAVLVYWVLGFLVEDIESIEGPRYDEIEKQYVDQDLVERKQELITNIDELGRSISNKRDAMQIVGDSSLNLQRTINQLIELKKLVLEKSDASLTETEQNNLSKSLAQFLDSQKQYQAHNEELSRFAEQKRGLETEKLSIGQLIEEQRKPAQEEYQRLREQHDIRLALFQFLVLLPILILAIILITKKRGSIYFPLFLGFGTATLLKVFLVIHKYFPTRYFKYILIFVLLIAVIKILIYFIRVVAFPKAHWLIKQYREAYERFLCPVCEYPIRIGPRKFLYWTRRTVNKNVVPSEISEVEPYSCPACGTILFEECSNCHEVRHALLPYCAHCNVEKKLTENSYSNTGNTG